MINVYSNNNHSALKYLKNTEANIHNILIIAEISDSFDLTLFSAIQQVSTWYSDKKNNSDINLFFLCSDSTELNSHKIHPDLHFLLDHTPLTVNIVIKEEFIPVKKQTLVKNSEDKAEFVKDFIRKFSSIDTAKISNKLTLKSIVWSYTDIAESSWIVHLQWVNVIR